MTNDTQHGGAVNRLENTRAGFVARYWRAAAYDDHRARSAYDWAILGFKVLGLGLLWIALAATVAYTVPMYATIPPEGTFVGESIGVLSGGHQAATGVFIALGVMYCLKCAARVADDPDLASAEALQKIAIQLERIADEMEDSHDV